MFSRKVSTLTALVALSLSSLLTSCTPKEAPVSTAQSMLSLDECSVPTSLGALALEFTLFCDGDLSKKILYYVPTRGMLRLDAPDTESPIPSFSVSQYVQPFGIFAGQQMMQVGGTFSIGVIANIKKLEKKAKSFGYKILPATVKSSTTSVQIWSMAAGVGIHNQELEIKCREEMQEVAGESLPVQNCYRKDPEDEYTLPVIYPVIGGVASKFWGSQPAGDVQFQFTAFDAILPDLTKRLKKGLSWDGLVSAKVDFTLDLAQLTHKAVVHVYWDKVYQMMSKHVGVNTPWVSVDVNEFFEKIATCEQGEECGIWVEWFDSEGNPTPRPSNNGDLVDAVKTLEAELRPRLFLEIIPSKSVLGAASSAPSPSFFTIRKNTELRQQKIREKFEVYYNPGVKSGFASTSLSINCLKGKPDGEIKWHMADEGCLSMLGQ